MVLSSGNVYFLWKSLQRYLRILGSTREWAAQHKKVLAVEQMWIGAGDRDFREEDLTITPQNII